MLRSFALCLALVLTFAPVLLVRPEIALAAAPTKVQSNAGSGASAASQAVTVSGTPAVGDVLVVTMYAVIVSADTITPPSGWSTVTSSTGATAEGYVFSCVVTASVCNGTSYTFTLATAAVVGWGITEWSGNNTLVTAWNPQASITRVTTASTAFTSPSVTPIAAGAQAVALMLYASGTATASAATGWTGDLAYQSVTNTVSVYSFNQNAATTTAAVSMAETLSSVATGITVTYVVYPQPSGLTLIQGVVGTAASTRSPTFTLPATPTVSDILVVEIQWSNVSSASFTTPSGWTIIDNAAAGASATDVGIATLYRVVQSGDTATFTWTNAISSASALYALYAREAYGQNATSPINVHSKAQTTSAVTLTVPSVTPTISGGIALSSAGIYDAAPTLPSGFTSSSSGNQSSYLYYNYAYQTGLGKSALAPSWGTVQGAADIVVLAPVTVSSCTSYSSLLGVGC
jgi:hypothetical protein